LTEAMGVDVAGKNPEAATGSARMAISKDQRNIFEMQLEYVPSRGTGNRCAEN